MQVVEIEEKIAGLFKSWCGEMVLKSEALPESGSYRKYYRLVGQNHKCIAVYNHDKKENLAFIEFTRHFFDKKLPVPEILATDTDNYIYLQEDLGDTSLYDYLTNNRKGESFTDELIILYKEVIDELLRFQITGNEDFNYAICYPRAAFDKQSMMWDLNYFKYYFLKLAKIPFYEQDLEDDFERFTDFLLQADRNYFLYRDFQSRNIMIKENQPYFIDYQGGRQGALPYDLASLLYDSKADIPQEIRNELRLYYISKLGDFGIDKNKFEKYYYAYVLIRIMQAMGAYGFRGFYEKKTHFLQSIPYAIRDLEYLLNTNKLPIEVPELMKVLRSLTQTEELKKYGKNSKRLTVNVFSFSYRKGIPVDHSGNGGGFVFDCRAVHNPGRYEQYMKLTGKDKEVIEFFEKETEMADYLKNVFQLIGHSIEKYQQRNFLNLHIAFGCTGGQHRSVYAAEKLALHLAKKYDLDIILTHRELK